MNLDLARLPCCGSAAGAGLLRPVYQALGRRQPARAGLRSARPLSSASRAPRLHSAEQADAAYKETLNLKPPQQQYADAPAALRVLRARRRGKGSRPLCSPRAGSASIPRSTRMLQAAAEQEVASQVKALNARGVTDGAVVAVRPATGEILAMVGSADFNNNQISGQIEHGRSAPPAGVPRSSR